MTSIQTKVDAVRAAVSSTSSYSPTTATILSDLLLPNSTTLEADIPTKPKPKSKVAVSARPKLPKSAAKAREIRAVDQENASGEEARLSQKERFILATEVINSTLRALSDANKGPPPSAVRRKQSSKDLEKNFARKALRRSSSVPQSPLQPRCLNRVSSSPNISNRQSRSSSSASLATSGHRPTAECARIAFACLRTLQTSTSANNETANNQIENGMSALIGKLITLGLDDLAIREIRILKRRLETIESKLAPRRAIVLRGKPSSNTPETLGELLNFENAATNDSTLGLVIATQLHVLRLLSSSRKRQQVEAALPVLSPSHPSSPSKLILMASKMSKQPEKQARQLQALSDLLLSLCPSISSADDAIALDERLSVDPDVAFQLQSLALHNRFLWWNLAGHEGDVAKELFDPFLRCLRACSRRSQRAALATYRMASSAFLGLQTLISDYKHAKELPHVTALIGIYRSLGSLAQEANLIDEAIEWTEKLQALMDNQKYSHARRTSVLAKLVALKLRQSKEPAIDESALFQLLEELERPFKGDSSEIDDLLNEVSAVRRAAITFLNARKTSTSATPGMDKAITNGMCEMCESLIFILPRLSLRYLGSPPDLKSATKDMVRYEQRRLFITKSGLHAIESALYMVKALSGEGRMTWEVMDSKLQECLKLLGRLDVTSKNDSSKEESNAPSFYVRISNLYYTQFLNMRRDAEGSKEGQPTHALRAVRRSVDSIRTCSARERKMGALNTKLERMAGVCKSLGRYDELLSTLLSLRDEMISSGVLTTVAASIAHQPIRAAWNQGEAAASLAHTIHSIVKVQLRYLRSASFTSVTDDTWSSEERAAVLENLLGLLLLDQPESLNVLLRLRPKVLQSLLAIYEVSQYPVRRLRVLISLLSLDLADRQQVEVNAEEELQTTQLKQISVEGTKDEGLHSYLAHYQTLARTTLELQGDQPTADVFKQAIATWSSIRVRCETLDALGREVDDVKGLLTHLKLMSDFMQMKGFDTTRTAVLRLIADINEISGDLSTPDELVDSFTSLGIQWLHLGYSGTAGLALDRAERYGHENGVTSLARQELHLAYAEYLLAIGNQDKSEEHLHQAQALNQHENGIAPEKNFSLQQKLRCTRLSSYAYSVHSMLAIERGTPQIALSKAKQSVRLLRRAWTINEERARRSSAPVDLKAQTDVEKLADEVSSLSMSTVNIAVKDKDIHSPRDSCFWALVTPLFRGLCQLSEVYAYQGMFQETIYYAEQAYKLVKDIGSEAHLALASAFLGYAWLKAGVLDKGSEFLMSAKKLSSALEKSHSIAVLAHYLGKMHGLLGDREAEIAAYEEAEELLEKLATTTYSNMIGRPVDPSEDLEEFSHLAISKRKVAGQKKTATRTATATRSRAATHASKPSDSIVRSVAAECTQMNSFKGRVLRQRARALMSMKKISEAGGLLIEANSLARSQLDVVEQGLVMAKHLLLQSVEQMHKDPVYTVLEESTISFPSVIGLSKIDKASADRLAVSRHSPPRKTQRSRKTHERGGSKTPEAVSFFDNLRQAYEQLVELHPLAVQFASLSVVHATSALLNTVAILLFAAGQVGSKSLAHPGLASSSIEMARNLALRHEHKSIQADIQSKSKLDDRSWPSLSSSDPRRSSLGLTCDMSRFQRDYIDLIPKSWTAISISLSDSSNELCISKLQAGQSPFVLRLPLGRNNSIDADEEVFGFEQGRSELMEIIELANESAHDARDLSGRQAKSAWWKEREALDARLHGLLENIEKVWLGGFTGIFSQHGRRADLLARFQKSFTNILDKHLPSRQKNSKRSASPRITLDSRILDLFIGLGDASDEASDFSEPLTDLLYFVVDVLQFHGELNAYAEIDFDSIVIETHDALRCYHEAARSLSQQDDGKHTILILDKALHAFPWESLPCMSGLAVSRLPSLSCLRDRIIQSHDDAPENGPRGRYVNRDNGTYILNPSGDLKNTQSAFQKSLEGLDEWHGVIAREPSEDEMREDLATKDLLLYFGHGSGAQYIRAREIKKLEICAVTVLMGCSSGALTEAGEFEPYGPPINYMHAGCPALVATLWDVTDKDIDRFAKSTFEHWGLFEKEEEVVGKRNGKGKVRVVEEEERRQVSLVEAVAKGKEACHLRYLNAAAVCVYGIPVYFK